MINVAKTLVLVSLLLTVGFGSGPRDYVEAVAPVMAAQVRVWSGKVTKVIDGDSFLVGPREIRLADIDAPEYEQPYGRDAWRVLQGLIHGRTVRIKSVTTDRHGRTVAHVNRDDGLRVNAAMIEAGAAYVYRRYTRDAKLIALESVARASGKGLWGLPEDQRTTPEQWRRENETIRIGFSCGVRKTRCRQMTSCDEARFYFTQCGADWLDGNRDGTPCERICKP